MFHIFSIPNLNDQVFRHGDLTFVKYSLSMVKGPQDAGHFSTRVLGHIRFQDEVALNYLNGRRSDSIYSEIQIQYDPTPHGM